MKNEQQDTYSGSLVEARFICGIARGLGLADQGVCERITQERKKIIMSKAKFLVVWLIEVMIGAIIGYALGTLIDWLASDD